jgi:hypothetical protein
MGRSRTCSSLVNAAELAALIGWPVDGVAVPNRPVALSAPPSAILVPPTTADGVDVRPLGRSLHASNQGAGLTLPMAAALSHSHFIRPTGSGKSTLLAQLILADAPQCGWYVLAWHGRRHQARLHDRHRPAH